MDTLFCIDLLDDIDIKPKIEVCQGNLFQLGKHRLLCGDCTVKENIDLLMNCKKADMIFTDPPYNVNYGDTFKKVKKYFHKSGRDFKPIHQDNMDNEDFQNFLSLFFTNIKPYLNTYNSYYIFCGSMNIDLFIKALKDNKFYFSNILIWNKNQSTISFLDYLIKFEPILYGWFGKHRFYKNGFYRHSVWDVDKPLVNKLHPTTKPIKLIENAILNSTLENMIVLDSFLGSGSTLIACEHTNRICYGMEIEEDYCSVIIERWQKYTNKKAIKLN